MKRERRYSAFFVFVLTLAVGMAFAGTSVEKKQDRGEIHQDKRQLKATDAALDRLSGTIDRWVEANLTEHDKKARNYERSIFEQIQVDIALTERQLEHYARETHRSAGEYTGPHASRAACHDDQADLLDDVQDFQLAQRLLKEKRRLASSLHKVSTFSNRYRLLGDYLEVMRRQLDIVRVELAEDVTELQEDRTQRRK